MNNRNLLRREQRRERAAATQEGFCAVCHYYSTHCRCAGARLFLRAEVERLQSLSPAKPLRKR